MCYSQDECLFTCHCTRVRQSIRDAQSWNEKWIFFMLLNNKFLGKFWYGSHPWIRLAMDCERMVEKGIKFIFVWQPPMIYLAWKVLGALSRFHWWENYASQIFFISQFKLWALAPLQIPTSLREGPFFYFCNFYFEFESPSSLIKHQLRGTQRKYALEAIIKLLFIFPYIMINFYYSC